MTVNSGNKMSRADLISEMANQAELTKEETSRALTAFINVVTQALRDRKEVQLVGFGSFCVSSRNATTARNPRTGEPIQIPSTDFPKFKAGKTLKDAVK